MVSTGEDGVMIKWEKLINKIAQIIDTEGKKILVFNVEAEEDAKRQYKNYQVTCEVVKNIFEAIVTTSFPGEERIFWPFHDTQFYIKEGDEKVHVTGNYDLFKKVLE